MSIESTLGDLARELTYFEELFESGPHEWHELADRGMSWAALAGTFAEELELAGHASVAATFRRYAAELPPLASRDIGERPARPDYLVKLSDLADWAQRAREYLDKLAALAVVRGGGGTPETRRDVPREPAITDESYLSPARLAESFGTPADALRKRLDRWRLMNDKGWKEVSNPGPREPRYLYRVGSIRPIIQELKASSERPARKK